MRVLVLNASPKGEQSHTMAITRAFLSGFPEGTQTELLELRHLNIRPCTGCLGCWTKTPGRCVQRDDMDRVYAAIAAADVVVESFPLYFYGIPGTLKTLTDRCLPYTKAYGWSSRAVHELRDPAMLEKRLVLISTCWHTGIERLYAAVRTAYARRASCSPSTPATVRSAPIWPMRRRRGARSRRPAASRTTRRRGWRGPSSRMPRSSASRARTGASSTNKQRRRSISAEYFFQNGCGTIPHPFSLTKSPFGPFRQAAFQNCKIEFCSIILQFCRCGG